MWRKSNFPCIPVLLPRGDIDVEVGSSPFSISCHLNPENKYYRDGHRSDRLGIYANQARRSGYDESRKTHIQSSFKSFGNWLHASSIQCGCGMLRQTLPEHATPTLDEASCPNCYNNPGYAFSYLRRTLISLPDCRYLSEFRKTSAKHGTIQNNSFSGVHF